MSNIFQLIKLQTWLGVFFPSPWHLHQVAVSNGSHLRSVWSLHSHSQASPLLGNSSQLRVEMVFNFTKKQLNTRQNWPSPKQPLFGSPMVPLAFPLINIYLALIKIFSLTVNSHLRAAPIPCSLQLLAIIFFLSNSDFLAEIFLFLMRNYSISF